MIPRRLLFVSLALALLAALISAQKDKSFSSVTTGDLRVVTFPTAGGDIRVTLPDDIRPGDTISGTVTTEPKGKDPTERKDNDERLRREIILIEEKRWRVSDGEIHLTIPKSEKDLQVALTDEQGKQLLKAILALKRLGEAMVRSQNPSFQFPELGQTGRPYSIAGPFDGDSTNTKVQMGDTQAKVIAESPRSAVVETPNTVVGPSNINVNDNGNSASGSFRGLKIDLTAPKSSLLKGESTELHVEVQGLQGITQPVPIQIQNQTPQNINLTGGNTQNILVQPSQVTTGGAFNWSTNVTGTGAGGFNITGTIPSAGSTVPTTTPATSKPTPAPTTISSSTSTSTSGAQTTASPSPSPSTANAARTSGPQVSPAPNIQGAATFTKEDTDCCKKFLNQNGELAFWDPNGNGFQIFRNKLTMKIDGKEYEWEFTQDGKPFYIEWMFCHLADHSIISQLSSVMVQRVKGGDTNESGGNTSVSMAGPYRDEKTNRPFYGFQFGAQKIGTRNKEYAISFSMDAEACKWSYQLFAEEKTAWYSTGPPGSPAQILNYLRNNPSLRTGSFYLQGSWWNDMYRVGGELQNWYAWLADHPNADQSAQLQAAYGNWSAMVKNALNSLASTASAADKQLFDQMRALLNNPNPTPEIMNQVFWKFNDLWMRYRGGAPSR